MTHIEQIISILNWFKEQAEANEVLDASMCLNKAHQLNALKESVDDKIVEYESAVAKIKQGLFEELKKVNAVELQIQTTREYVTLQKLKAMEKRVVTTISLAKKASEISRY